jgi:hypothetical protein
MKGARKRPAANPRSWRVIIIRSKGDISARSRHQIGEAEAVAIKQIALDVIKQFALDDHHRSGLLIRERRTASASQTL